MSTAHKRAAKAAGIDSAATPSTTRKTTSKGHDGAALEAARNLARQAAVALDNLDREGGNVTDLCVDAVQAAYTSGLLALKGGDAPEMTGRAYMTAYFPGRAETLLTYWTTLYLARDVVGIDAATFTALKTSPVGGGSKPAQVSAVSKAVRDPKATAHKVSSALGTLFTTTPDGKVTRKAVTPRKSGAASGAGKGKAPAASAKPSTPNVQARDAVATLRKVWSSLTVAQRKAVSNGLVSLMATGTGDLAKSA